MDVSSAIAAQRAVEKTLEKTEASKDQLRLIIDSIPGMVWSTLPDGHADFVNRRWREYTGISLEQASGRRWISAIHPEDLTRFEGKWRATLVAGTPMEIEARIRGSDGKYRWFVIRVVPLEDEAGNIVKWYGTNTDIEGRKRAEEALRASESKLAHVTRVLTLGELVASIAHEIKQPLASVVTNGGACLRWLARETPELSEAREAARRMVRAAKQADEVITGIRALLEKSDVKKTRLSINEAIQEVVLLTQSAAIRKDVMVKTDLANDLPKVFGDRVQLQQVLINLVINGIEAMASASDRPRELLISSGRDEARQVVIRVKDSGEGIRDEDLEKIFDAFHTTKPHGLGIGLAISRCIVENHDGRLWAEANGGPGASFLFTLPQHRPQGNERRDKGFLRSSTVIR